MRRLFWLAVGLGAGATAAVLAARWARRQTERMAPANLAARAGEVLRDVGTLLEEAAREFRAGMAEKEAEVRAALEGRGDAAG
ncbi:MAG TPA: hypothetical protein VNO34_09470 [Actinomycetota bacterium]|nr:hypothetical protein [Actinomycetota bacterium]